MTTIHDALDPEAMKALLGARFRCTMCHKTHVGTRRSVIHCQQQLISLLKLPEGTNSRRVDRLARNGQASIFLSYDLVKKAGFTLAGDSEDIRMTKEEWDRFNTLMESLSISEEFHLPTWLLATPGPRTVAQDQLNAWIKTVEAKAQSLLARSTTILEERDAIVARSKTRPLPIQTIRRGKASLSVVCEGPWGLHGLHLPSLLDDAGKPKPGWDWRYRIVDCSPSSALVKGTRNRKSRWWVLDLMTDRYHPIPKPTPLTIVAATLLLGAKTK